MKRSFAFFLMITLLSFNAQAFFTEVGLNYGRKKTSFDADNYFDSESLTGSISFYFKESLALEMSYTSATAVREETIRSGTTVVSRQTVVQTTQVYGADLIWPLASRQAFFQPYLKGGVAQIQRVQEVKVNDLNTYKLEPEVALVPSYGIGFKLAMTQTFAFKVSYDGWKTPLGGGAFSNDDALRVGVTWLF